jgi:hypothetical protein
MMVRQEFTAIAENFFEAQDSNQLRRRDTKYTLDFKEETKLFFSPT